MFYASSEFAGAVSVDGANRFVFHPSLCFVEFLPGELEEEQNEATEVEDGTSNTANSVTTINLVLVAVPIWKDSYVYYSYWWQIELRYSWY